MEEKDLRRGREGKGGGGDLRKEGSLILDMFDYRCKRKNQIQMIYQRGSMYDKEVLEPLARTIIKAPGDFLVTSGKYVV